MRHRIAHDALDTDLVNVALGAPMTGANHLICTIAEQDTRM